MTLTRFYSGASVLAAMRALRLLRQMGLDGNTLSRQERHTAPNALLPQWSLSWKFTRAVLAA